jgi:hypothetical protein
MKSRSDGEFEHHDEQPAGEEVVSLHSDGIERGRVRRADGACFAALRRRPH